MASRGYDPMGYLECPICKDAFNTPKMLPCGHTLCLSPCLEQLAGGLRTVRCPECRSDHVVPGGNVANFPTNFLITRLLDEEKRHKEAVKEGIIIVLCNSIYSFIFKIIITHYFQDIVPMSDLSHIK